jgi:3-hydroxypropanoate dehydrogenase
MSLANGVFVTAATTEGNSEMSHHVDDHTLGVLFRDARTHNGWQDRPVPEEVLRAAWDLAKMGPTSANCMPARIVFVVSREAKEKLRPCLAEGNVEKTMAAPATAIIGHDLTFYEKLPELFPHTDARAWFVGNDALIAATAFRNGTLQGGYFIIAARAMGLDCGPMSGFDNAKVDEAFFAGTAVKSNFLCNLGYGDPAKLYPRNRRLSFDEACRIA